jgi:hypothetical protein
MSRLVKQSDSSFTIYTDEGFSLLKMHISSLGNLVVSKSIRETVRIHPEEIDDFMSAINQLWKQICQK